MLLFNDMRLKIAVVILILLSSAYWPTNLPSFVFFLCILGYVVTLRFDQAKLIQGILLGLIIASSHITYYQSINEGLYSQGHNITIKGEIQSLIAFKETTSSILVQVREINTVPVMLTQSPLVRISLRDYKKNLINESVPVLFRQGQIWEFNVKLRPPIGRHNEVGYKLEDYALAKGIHSYGKIKNALLLEDTPSIRNQWFERVYSQTQDKEFQSLLLALTFGYKGDIETSEWRVLRNSGLAHLMAISGLHIGFVFAIGWWGGKLLRVIYTKDRHLWFPVISGCLFAIFYAWLADFSLPTIRALIACFLVSFLLISRCCWPKHLILLWCVVLCLIINPFSSLSMSFWLSFSAVCVVFLSLHLYQMFIQTHRNTVIRKWSQIIAVQFGLFALLAPVQGYFFTGISYLSPLINLVSVPWVSISTVPLSLLAVVLEPINVEVVNTPWFLADLSIAPIWWIAEKSDQAWLLLSKDVNLIIICVIVFVMLRLFLPMNFFLQPVVLVIIGSLLIKPQAKWQVDFLDVGHGLSVLLSSKGHTVVYDTGMKWNNGSIAETVIEPVLRSRGIRSIDGLIISHSDNDHAGGKSYLINHFAPLWVRTSEKGQESEACIKGQRWEAGPMEFTAIWPPKLVGRAYNPHSCVIKARIEQWTFLLTGDIDAISEMLILNQNDFSDVDVFLVPHHGSNSSSTNRWVDEMKNKVAVVSAGRFSPWDLPSAAIIRKHEEKGIKWLDTAQLGQISITSNNDKLFIKGYSMLNHSVWYRKLFGDNLNSE